MAQLRTRQFLEVFKDIVEKGNTATFNIFFNVCFYIQTQSVLM